MLFFRSLLIFILLIPGAFASGLKEVIVTREHGSCQTNNLYFSAMKFYKIPLNEKFESYDKYLRLIYFFNLDGTFTERVTVQALLGCQTQSNGEVACSYHALEDSWIKSRYTIVDNTITLLNTGSVTLTNADDTNRGFTLTFKNDFTYPHLRGQNFTGGMVAVNFDQDARNTINICK